MASVTDYLSTFLPIWDSTAHDPAATRRGAALLADGCITPVPAGWHVTDGTTHLVTYTHPHYRCSCGERRCHHTEAVALMVQSTLLVARAHYAGSVDDLQADIGRELPQSSGHRRQLLKALWDAAATERLLADVMAARSAHARPALTPLSRSLTSQLAAQEALASCHSKRELHQAGYHVLTCVCCRRRYARRTQTWGHILCEVCHSPEMLTEMRRVRTYNREASKRNQTGLYFPHWLDALDTFGWGCAYCGRAGDVTLDHFIPQAAGGAMSRGNVVPACRHCNYVKGNALPSEAKLGQRTLWRVTSYLTTHEEAAPSWPPRTGKARSTDQASGRLPMSELVAWVEGAR